MKALSNIVNTCKCCQPDEPQASLATTNRCNHVYVVLFFILLFMSAVIHCLYSVGNKITTTTNRRLFSKHILCCSHYINVIMSTMASQITSLMIVYWTIYSGADDISKLRVTGLCAGTYPLTGEFPAQRASNAKMFHLMSSSWSGGVVMTDPVSWPFHYYTQVIVIWPLVI